jgi:hypothetical protein
MNSQQNSRNLGSIEIPFRVPMPNPGFNSPIDFMVKMLERTFKNPDTLELWDDVSCSFFNLIRLFILVSKLIFISVVFIYITNTSNYFMNLFSRSHNYVNIFVKFMTINILVLFIVFSIWLVQNNDLENNPARRIRNNIDLTDPDVCKSNLEWLYSDDNRMIPTEHFPLLYSISFSTGVSLLFSLMLYTIQV